MDGGAIHEQARRLNRILSVGAAGEAVVKGHLATGDEVEGNPVWVFDLEIRPEAGLPYLAEHREIVSSATTASYPDGARLACRIDPDNPEQIAFGERPFL
jgi:hypothetical protein